MKLGIIGLPNVGKSTIFNVLTNKNAKSANYPFCTIEKNIGIVSVPDERLNKLAEIYNSYKLTPVTLEFVDIAGLVKGASRGEGLGNKFLADIRNVDAIIHVVRCFEDTNIVHVDGNINSIRDIENINLELIFSDIETIDRRIDHAKKATRVNNKEIDFLENLKKYLETGKSAKFFNCTEEETKLIKSIPLLSAKPVIYAANLSETDFIENIENNENFCKVRNLAEQDCTVVLPICAKAETEIAEMDAKDKAMFLSELGLEISGINRIIKESYSLLNLISFLTVGKQEVRAWTIKRGTKAPQAAGKIHTDFERGFICAEIIAYDDFINCGNMVSAKNKGLLRLEGKEYVMKDGDIVLFRFNI